GSAQIVRSGFAFIKCLDRCRCRDRGARRSLGQVQSAELVADLGYSLDPSILASEGVRIVGQPLQLRNRIAELDAVRVDDVGGDRPVGQPRKEYEVWPDD